MHIKRLILAITLSLIFVLPVYGQKYRRQEWNHWIDSDHNCLNTRAEILKQNSLEPIALNKKGCSVILGKWEDYYFKQFHTNALEVDIDHLIPLKNAHISGGSAWAKEAKETFANDPDNLVITNRNYNRQKGSKGIDEWLPVGKDYACKYIKQWIKIKTKYSLKILEPEKKTIDLLKTDCKF